MNLSKFFEHWSIIENPFKGEEARQDPVFARLELTSSGNGHRPKAEIEIEPKPAPVQLPAHTTHSDFEKIAGEVDRPSTAIVFGEKGSGKTAIRMQIAQRIEQFNQGRETERTFMLPYDDLNPILDRFTERIGVRDDDYVKAFAKFRLIDHMDAMLSIAVPRIVDGLLQESAGSGAEPMELSDTGRKAARKMESSLKRDLLILQAVYDRQDRGHERTSPLRRLLRLAPPRAVVWTDGFVYAGWLLPVLAVSMYGIMTGFDTSKFDLWGWIIVAALAVWGAALFKRFVWERFTLGRLGRKIRKQIRVATRTDESYGQSLRHVDPLQRTGSTLPLTDSDEQRYAMFDRLRRVLRALGYSTIITIVDRVDEPTLISGNAERMRGFIWPLFNHKFLQQDGYGFKMLLPIELRYELFRESSNFFQEARLDKQNLVERLTWTGAMLYDLCNARLRACRGPKAPPMTLLDLFSDDVSRNDLVDALDQMHQPRDAFKMLYQCLTEHCSNVTEDAAEWKIPKLVLEGVRKNQSERVRGLYRGVRPA